MQIFDRTETILSVKKFSLRFHRIL